MRTLHFTIIVTLAAALVALMLAVIHDDVAMRQCQLTVSEDVCKYSLR